MKKITDFINLRYLVKIEPNKITFSNSDLGVPIKIYKKYNKYYIDCDGYVIEVDYLDVAKYFNLKEIIIEIEEMKE